MEYTIHLEEENKIVVAVPKGEWELETDNRMIHQIMELVNTTEARNVLLDIRGLHLNLSIVEIFEHAKEVREKRQGFNKVSTKVAIVYAMSDSKMEEDMLFFETAARNRGLPYQVFRDFEIAMLWLREE
ncbi:MAG: hypothetical protein IH589_14470 [Anaerolineales bacterium]|nr:hypothetical protein [Anaerolineales bacterium]